MSAKVLSGTTSFISEYIAINRFSTKFKTKPCCLIDIRLLESLETERDFVCFVYLLIVSPSKLFALVLDLFSLLHDNFN